MLDSTETASARKQGWLVAEVFDPRTKRLLPQILPVAFTKPFTTARSAGAWVVSRARQGDALALKALQLVMQGMKQ